MIHPSSHLQDYGIAAELGNDHVYLIDHLVPLRPEVSINRQQADTAGYA